MLAVGHQRGNKRTIRHRNGKKKSEKICSKFSARLSSNGTLPSNIFFSLNIYECVCLCRSFCYTTTLFFISPHLLLLTRLLLSVIGIFISQMNLLGNCTHTHAYVQCGCRFLCPQWKYCRFFFCSLPTTNEIIVTMI